jgi:hypothetical protein
MTCKNGFYTLILYLFTVYLMVLSVSQTIISIELERIWKEVILPWSDVLSHHLCWSVYEKPQKTLKSG